MPMRTNRLFHDKISRSKSQGLLLLLLRCVRMSVFHKYHVVIPPMPVHSFNDAKWLKYSDNTRACWTRLHLQKHQLKPNGWNLEISWQQTRVLNVCFQLQRRGNDIHVITRQKRSWVKNSRTHFFIFLSRRERRNSPSSTKGQNFVSHS